MEDTNSAQLYSQYMKLMKRNAPLREFREFLGAAGGDNCTESDLEIAIAGLLLVAYNVDDQLEMSERAAREVFFRHGKEICAIAKMISGQHWTLQIERQLLFLLPITA